MINDLFFALITLSLAGIGYVLFSVWRKNIYIWFPAYISQMLGKQPIPDPTEPVHIIFCFVDHYEPKRGAACYEIQCDRVDTWITKYPELCAKHKDSFGRYPQHTFFYPEEEYEKEHLDKLTGLCKAGFGDVEIHLHHDNDTGDGLKAKLESFKEKLSKHGLLSRDEKGKITYGFIHGNWALDNSRKDGRYCGVNNELLVLKETGCYADFTLPSAPSDTQTRKINSIYYATDDPNKPKSHDTGVDVEAGIAPEGDLMIIQGPLTLNFVNRKWGFLPRIEDGKIDSTNPPNSDRVNIWIKQNIHVKGNPNWVFVKVYTHGAQEEHYNTLLGKPMDDMFSYLESEYNDCKKYKLHYVTAREMFGLIKNLEKKSRVQL